MTKKKLGIILGQGLLIFLPIIFSPFITDFLCNISVKKIDFQGQVVDKETRKGLNAEISFNGNVLETDNVGNFELTYTTNYSSYPGCKNCETLTVLSFKVVKDGKYSIYNFPLDENVSNNPSKIEFTFPNDN